MTKGLQGKKGAIHVTGEELEFEGVKILHKFLNLFERECFGVFKVDQDILEKAVEGGMGIGTAEEIPQDLPEGLSPVDEYVGSGDRKAQGSDFRGGFFAELIIETDKSRTQGESAHRVHLAGKLSDGFGFEERGHQAIVLDVTRIVIHMRREFLRRRGFIRNQQSGRQTVTQPGGWVSVLSRGLFAAGIEGTGNKYEEGAIATHLMDTRRGVTDKIITPGVFPAVPDSKGCVGRIEGKGVEIYLDFFRDFLLAEPAETSVIFRDISTEWIIGDVQNKGGDRVGLGDFNHEVGGEMSCFGIIQAQETFM